MPQEKQPSQRTVCRVCGSIKSCPHRRVNPDGTQQPQAPAPLTPIVPTDFDGIDSQGLAAVWIDPSSLAQFNTTGAGRGNMAQQQLSNSPFEEDSFLLDDTSVSQRVKPDRQSRVSPKYPHPEINDENLTEIPTLPPPAVWQYDSPDYEVESSLPSLSLVNAELPTRPEPPAPTLRGADLLSGIDSLKTIPPPKSPRQTLDIDDLPTAPPPPVSKQTKKLSATTATTSESTRAKKLGDQAGFERKARRHSRRQEIEIRLGPLDRVRWWLLHPGRLEFMLWLGGTILLMAITCFLLLVAALSFSWITPVSQSSAHVSISTAVSSPDTTSTLTSTSGPMLILLRKDPLMAGQSFYLHGQDFSPHGGITFTLDGKQAFLDLAGQPVTIQADAQGEFTIALTLASGTAWSPGNHTIVALDKDSNRQAEIIVTLATTTSTSSTLSQLHLSTMLLLKNKRIIMI